MEQLLTMDTVGEFKKELKMPDFGFNF